MEYRLFGYAVLVYGDIIAFERTTHSPLQNVVVGVYRRALYMPCVEPVAVANKLENSNPEVAVVAFAMHDGDLTNEVKLALAYLMTKRTVLGFVHLSEDGVELLATYVGAIALRQLAPRARQFFDDPHDRPL